MLVKLLDSNRIKVLMEEHDILKYDLPFEKLDYNDPVSRTFIYDLLKKTHRQTGVDFSDSRVMIEVIPGFSGTYYILLTRLEKSGDHKIEFDKSQDAENELYIFRIETADEVYRLIRRLNVYRPIKSELYCYNQKYYLFLSYAPRIVSEPGFHFFISQLEEYGGRCSFNLANESVLKERGKLLIDGDVIESLMKT